MTPSAWPWPSAKCLVMAKNTQECINCQKIEHYIYKIMSILSVHNIHCRQFAGKENCTIPCTVVPQLDSYFRLLMMMRLNVHYRDLSLYPFWYILNSTSFNDQVTSRYYKETKLWNYSTGPIVIYLISEVISSIDSVCWRHLIHFLLSFFTKCLQHTEKQESMSRPSTQQI